MARAATKAGTGPNPSFSARLDAALAAANTLAPPAAPSLAERPPTMQIHVETAPRLTREQADALLAGRPSISEPSRAASASAIAPGVVPPTAASLPTPADLAPTIEVELTPAIVSKAAALGNSPLAIYEFVRNSVRFQPYLGSRKGAARAEADRAVDAVRDRFGWAAVRYACLDGGRPASVPDAFRRLAEKEL